MKQPLVPEIAIFVRTLELGTFAAVAKETGFTSSGVSRIISRLEDSLGVKLLYRSTRRLALTPEGETFAVYARNILEVVEAAEADVSKVMGRPRGHLRVNCGTAFAHHKLAPLLPLLLERYPEITVDISVSDRRIDPVAEQIDVTVRVGPLADSDLIAIRLGTVKRVIAASPDYLAARGTPRSARDLLDHDCLLLTGFSRQTLWPLYENSRRIEIAVRGAVTSDSADALLQAAIAGVGIIRLGDFLGTEALASGRLVPLLADCHDDDPQPITALVSPGRLSIPRVRVFVDFLKYNFAHGDELAPLRGSTVNS
ncbi:LysR family transcriptional regulator [Algihabitans albus]|uniref:LysR family transcriptional regulator n=1 Tax=Algihabitans albus TaxID=2164067 RepID=UPI000E5CACD6|nr:LysR family transcriptional regulator [Algihabitans albus]